MKTERLKVLLLTAPYGNGHLQVAKTLKSQFEKNNCEVIVYDMYTEDYPITASVVKNAYLKSYNNNFQKQAYRFFYYGSEKLLDMKIASLYINFGVSKVIEMIEEHNPDVILNTFPVMSTYVLEKKGYNIPIYTIITDYHPSRAWVYNKTKLNFIATDKMIPYLNDKGITNEQIKITGIPLREQFYQPVDKEKIYKKFDLTPDKKILLIFSGAHGVLPKTENMIKAFAENKEIQVVVICGNNQKLKKDITKKIFGIHNRKFVKDTLNMPSVYHQNVRILGYVDEIHELMSVADLMITKPGGITLTESAVIGVPVVLFSPSYGQELENAKYFSDMGAALIANDEGELLYSVFSTLENDYLLKTMKENIKSIGIRNSSQLIVDEIKKDYQKTREVVSATE